MFTPTPPEIVSLYCVPVISSLPFPPFIVKPLFLFPRFLKAAVLIVSLSIVSENTVPVTTPFLLALNIFVKDERIFISDTGISASST